MPPTTQEASARYNEFTLEKESITRHRQWLSELHGHDIGFEPALHDWIQNCRKAFNTWRRTTILNDPTHPLHQFYKTYG